MTRARAHKQSAVNEKASRDNGGESSDDLDDLEHKALDADDVIAGSIGRETKNKWRDERADSYNSDGLKKLSHVILHLSIDLNGAYSTRMDIASSSVIYCDIFLESA